MIRTNQITADFIWRAHRAGLGGKSAVTGAPLPEKLTDCNPGVQAAHYGIALAAARFFGGEDPPVPEGVSEAEARRVRSEVAGG